MIIRENVPISELTTMRLGGEAKFVIDIETADEIPEVFDFVYQHNLPFFFLGEGANSIGRDEGFEGVILRNKLRGIQVIDENKLMIRGMGGEHWDDVVKFTTDLGWSGIEAMSAIPGTLGAAPVQNIGAYGQDLSQTIVEVEAFDTFIDEFVTIPKEDMKMGYRSTIFNSGEKAGRYLIVSVTLKLNKDPLAPPFYNSLQRFVDEHGVEDFSPANIREIVMQIRDSKLPDPKKIASAGSFFKNVYVSDAKAEELEKLGARTWKEKKGNKVNTGWLIEQSGLKGKELFGFRVSDRAALVLINESARSYFELEKAVNEIKREVKAKFGVELMQEPVEICADNAGYGKPDLLDPRDNCLGAAL